MLYQISFEKNTVCQCRLIDADSADTARAYFEENEPRSTAAPQPRSPSPC